MCTDGKSQAIKKPACGRLLGGGSYLFLVSSDRLVNQVAGLIGASPAFNLDPLALLQIFVVLEEVLDLLDQQWGQVGVFLYVFVQHGQFVVRYGNQLGVAAGFVAHQQHANWTGADNRTWCHWIWSDNQYVEGGTPRRPPGGGGKTDTSVE